MATNLTIKLALLELLYDCKQIAKERMILISMICCSILQQTLSTFQIIIRYCILTSRKTMQQIYLIGQILHISNPKNTKGRILNLRIERIKIFYSMIIYDINILLIFTNRTNTNKKVKCR